MHKLLFVSLNFILFLLSQIIQPKSLYKDHKPTVSLETGTSQKSNSEAFNSFQKEKNYGNTKGVKGRDECWSGIN